MNERLTKQIYKTCVNKIDKGRPRRAYHGQIENVLKKARDRRVYIKALMPVDVKDMCQVCGKEGCGFCLLIWEKDVQCMYSYLKFKTVKMWRILMQEILFKYNGKRYDVS